MRHVIDVFLCSDPYFLQCCLGLVYRHTLTAKEARPSSRVEAFRSAATVLGLIELLLLLYNKNIGDQILTIGIPAPELKLLLEKLVVSKVSMNHQRLYRSEQSSEVPLLEVLRAHFEQRRRDVDLVLKRGFFFVQHLVKVDDLEIV